MRNDILTIACLVEINGEVVDQLELSIQPHSYENVQAGALAVNGLTMEDLKGFMLPSKAHTKLTEFMDKYVDKYNKEDKFTPAGYNVQFDVGFLRDFFKKCGDKYYGSYFDYHAIDPMQLAQMITRMGYFGVMNFKLVTVCKHFGISLDAHIAMEDIKATREVLLKLIDLLKGEPNESNGGGK